MRNLDQISLPAISIIFVCLLLNCDASRIPEKQKVCVIGAGQAGLATTKQLVAYPDEFDIVVFERNSGVGGLWLYTDKSGVDEHGLPVHSSIYKYLITNTPWQTMTYPDYRNFDGGVPSCVKHEKVLNYIQNFTRDFELKQYVQFNTWVEKVTPRVGNAGWRTTKHEVRTRNLDTNKTSTTICDAVVVCSGNLFEPNIPEIPGIDGFEGKVIHSHDYRVPEIFSGETVVLLGARTSGTDIGLELSKYAKKVYLSHNHEKIMSPDPPANIEQVTGVQSAVGNTLLLRDGSNITADSLIFCTGYIYSYPFLGKQSGLTITKKYVTPLYKYIVNVEHPSMGFINLPNVDAVGNFATAYSQAKYYIAVLRGTVPLPDKDTMLKESEIKNKAKPYDHLREEQPALIREMAEAAGFDQLPKFYENGLKKWVKFFAANLWHAKESNVIIVNDSDMLIVHPNGTIS